MLALYREVVLGLLRDSRSSDYSSCRISTAVTIRAHRILHDYSLSGVFSVPRSGLTLVRAFQTVVGSDRVQGVGSGV